MPLPQYRTSLYIEWRACERLGLIPTGISQRFDENPIPVQMLILGYSEIREQEDNELLQAQMSARSPI